MKFMFIFPYQWLSSCYIVNLSYSKLISCINKIVYIQYLLKVLVLKGTASTGPNLKQIRYLTVILYTGFSNTVFHLLSCITLIINFRGKEISY